MKKITLISALLTIFSLPMLAQEAGALRAGAGLAIGTEAGLNDDGEEALGLGLNIGAEYFIIDPLSAAVSYTFFFKSTVDLGPVGESSIRMSSINIDARYYFLRSSVEAYGIAGLSIASATVESTFNIFGTTQTSETSDSEVGLNIGAGANVGVTDALGVNIQAIYNTPLEQPIFNLGLYYRIL
jgi:hypothetical protein